MYKACTGGLAAAQSQWRQHLAAAATAWTCPQCARSTNEIGFSGPKRGGGSWCQYGSWERRHVYPTAAAACGCHTLKPGVHKHQSNPPKCRWSFGLLAAAVSMPAPTTQLWSMAGGRPACPPLSPEAPTAASRGSRCIIQLLSKDCPSIAIMCSLRFRAPTLLGDSPAGT